MKCRGPSALGDSPEVDRITLQGRRSTSGLKLLANRMYSSRLVWITLEELGQMDMPKTNIWVWLEGKEISFYATFHNLQGTREPCVLSIELISEIC